MNKCRRRLARRRRKLRRFNEAFGFSSRDGDLLDRLMTLMIGFEISPDWLAALGAEDPPKG
jgi:hypothetical protein